jgi:myo-inositol-1(or 4)-monophosphatase
MFVLNKSEDAKMDFTKVLNLIREVGEYQLENFEKAHIIETKSNVHDLVTEVDKESERRINEFLEREYPDHSVLGEEGTDRVGSSEYKWIVDPLDGTVNYAHGFPIFAISLALEKNGEFVFGAIYVPKLNEMYRAEKGKGAYLNDRKIQVSDCESLNEALVATGFPYVRSGPYDNIHYFNHMYRITRGIRRPGSAAFDLACVAAGRIDGFWEFNLKPWDAAAGMGIIREAGGKVIDLTSEERGTALTAGNSGICDEIYSELKKVNEML